MNIVRQNEIVSVAPEKYYGTREFNTKKVPTCSFCNKKGHTRDECFTRKNSPYCISCQEYGHEMSLKCSKPNVHHNKINKEENRDYRNKKSFSNMRCYNCGKQGHVASKCFLKGNSHTKSQYEPENYSGPNLGQ